tara:strand:+ start:1024 stop:1356 length:333 start_codon:yes stop_codon:yes gene_type:complete
MQLAYQSDSISSEKTIVNNIGSLQSNSKGVVNNFKAAQQSVLSHKSQNEVYGNSRIFSPYQSPSSVVIADKIIQKSSFSPIFMHNAAITKSYFISKPAQPKEHAKINIFA